MLPFFSTRYVDTFGVFDVNRAISMLIFCNFVWLRAAQSWWQCGSGAGGISGLLVDFLGPTIRSQKCEHVIRCGMSRASRKLLGPGAYDTTCGRQVFLHFPTHVNRQAPLRPAPSPPPLAKHRPPDHHACTYVIERRMTSGCEDYNLHFIHQKSTQRSVTRHLVTHNENA